MDKYQQTILKKLDITMQAKEGNGSVAFDEKENMVLTQNENYNITAYTLCLKGEAVQKVSVKNYDGMIVEYEKDNGAINVPIHMGSPDLITVTFTKDMAEPCNVKLKYVKADKGAYDAKCKEQIRLKNLPLLDLAVQPSINGFVNVYFNHCCASTSTALTLYAVIESRFKDETDNYPEKQRLVETKYFNHSNTATACTFTNLAPGTYRLHVLQEKNIGTYDRAKYEFLTEDEVTFTIEDITKIRYRVYNDCGSFYH